MKKVLATLLAFAMIVTGFLCLNPKASEVKAAETTVTDHGTYRAVAIDDCKKDSKGVPYLEGYLFAGYFKDAACTLENQATKNTATHAKFVSDDMLDIKIQITNGTVQKSYVENEDGTSMYEGKYVIRFVSSVDSLNYKNIGFELTYMDGDTLKTKTSTTSKVFKRISSTTGKVDGNAETYEFSPKVVGEDSEYFMTAKLPVDPKDVGVEYTVRAFWTTFGNVKVYGDARTVCVNDGAENIINMQVKGATYSLEGSVVKYTNAAGTEKEGTVTEYSYNADTDVSNVRITLADGDKAKELKSATKFTFYKDGVEAADAIYRNYYTKYTGTGTEDTSWYDVNPNATEFVIATSADLYGLAAIQNVATATTHDTRSNDIFLNKTITLVRNVTVNEGKATVDGWTAATGATKYLWTQVGDAYYRRFRGTFDGDGNTISGIVVESTANYIGFFGYTAENASFKNFKLVNSYIKGASNTGIIGNFYGTECENIYTDAIINGAAGYYVGGIVGNMTTSNTLTASNKLPASFKNCWFDGKIISTSAYTPKVGGILGATSTSKFYDISFENCLMTGDIEAKGSHIGGIFGGEAAGGDYTFKNCLVTGNISSASGKTVGSLCGGIVGTSVTHDIVDVYTTLTDLDVYGASTATVSIPDDYKQDKDGIIKKSVDDLFPTANGAWTEVEDGTPVLSLFADWWEKEKRVIAPDTGWYEAGPDENNTYTINTAADLYGLASIVNAGTDTFSGKTIKLGKNIALNESSPAIAMNWSNGVSKPANNWTPIGNNETNAFAGTFDGNGCEIKGLYLNTSDKVSGMFAYTSNTAVIKDFKLLDSYMTSSYNTDNTGALGIIGIGDFDKIADIYTNAIIEGEHDTSSNKGTAIGGFVGKTKQTDSTKVLKIENCWFDGEASGDGYATGGFVGKEETKIQIQFTNCLSTGKVSGYFAAGGFYGNIDHGWSYAPDKWVFVNCLSLAEMEVVSAPAVGGFIGHLNSYRGNDSTTLTNSYCIENVIGKYRSESTPSTLLNDVSLKTREYLINTDVADLFSGSTAWRNEVEYNNTDRGTPILETFADWWLDRQPEAELAPKADTSWYDAGPDENNTYTIKTAAELYGLSVVSQNDDFDGNTVQIDENVKEIVLNKVDADILDLWKEGAEPLASWTPIGNSTTPFAGTFDGNGCEIKGLYLNTSDKVSGMFAYTSNTAVIKDFKLLDSYIASSYNTDNAGALGIIGIGDFDKIADIYTNAIIEGEHDTSSNKGTAIGGFVGKTKQTDFTKVLRVENCWFDGEASGDGYATGGFVGKEETKIQIQFTNCLSTGKVSGYFEVGGFYGNIDHGWDYAPNKWVFVNCLSLAEMEVVSAPAVGGFIGRLNSYRGNDSTTLINSYCIENVIGKYRSETTPSTLLNDVSLKTRDYLINSDEIALFPVLDGETVNAWRNDVGYNATDRGTPILDSFADWWLARQPKTELKDRVDTSWYYANPDAETFTISTASELYGLATVAQIDDFKGQTIQIAKGVKTLSLNTVDADILASWRAESRPEKEWIPIGNASVPFAGIFNGNDCEIKGLYLNVADADAGMFGVTAGTAQIKNFKLTDSYLKSTYATDLNGGLGIVGEGDAKLVENIYIDAIFEGKSACVGSVFGRLTPEDNTEPVIIQKCWFDGAVLTETGLAAGGFVGRDTKETHIEYNDCLSTGKVTSRYRAGGFQGYINSGYRAGGSDYATDGWIFNNCLSVADVSITDTSGNVLYGAGAFYGSINTDAKSLTMNQTYGVGNVMVGYYKASAGKYENSDYLKSRNELLYADVATLFSGSNAWKEDTGKNNIDRGTPILSDFEAFWLSRRGNDNLEMELDLTWYTNNPDATTFNIQNREQLLALPVIVNNGESFEGATINLLDDIELNEADLVAWETGITPEYVWIPVGNESSPFEGTFNGNGKMISGLYTKANKGYIGFFGLAGEKSNITDLKIADSYFEQIATTGTKYAGAVVAQTSGNLSELYSNATVKSNRSNVGGIVGAVNADGGSTITNCWFEGQIKSGESAQNIGGIVGNQLSGKLTMSNLMFTGELVVGRTNNERAYAGGILGYTSRVEGIEFDMSSVVSAGEYVVENEVKNISSVVGWLSNGVLNNTTPMNPTYSFENVFTTRAWNNVYDKNDYCAYNNVTTKEYQSEMVIEGAIVQTAVGDRLMGYVPQDLYNEQSTDKTYTAFKINTEFNPHSTLVTEQKLNFVDDWTLRTNGVPVLKIFANDEKVVKTNTIVSTDEMSAMESTFTSASAEGAGEYVITKTCGSVDTFNTALSKLAGFEEYANNEGTTMRTDGVYNATYYKRASAGAGEWVVNATYVAKESKAYYVISGNGDALPSTLLDSNSLGVTNGNNPISLSMVEDKEVTGATGNCFVFQLPNGHFIINDGNIEGGSGKILKAYLQSLVGPGNPIYIDAWTISHFHNDHGGALIDMATDASLRENVYVNAVYANETSAYGTTLYEDRTAKDINNILQGVVRLQKSEEDASSPDVYQVHMGERYYFNGITMDVVNTPDQISVDSWNEYDGNNIPDEFNTSSINFVFTLKQTGKKVLLGGDSNHAVMKYVMMAYGDNTQTLANINVFAAYHHGNNVINTWNPSHVYVEGKMIEYNSKGSEEWMNYLLKEGQKFDVMLFPNYKVSEATIDDSYSATHQIGTCYGIYNVDGDRSVPYNIGELNQKYITNSNLHFTTGYQDSVKGATTDNRHGTVKINFSATEGITYEVFGSVHGKTDYVFEAFNPGVVLPEEDL